MAKKKTRRDVAEIARETLEQIIGERLTGEPLDKPKAHKPSKPGASKGGTERAKKLTKESRSLIAKKAAAARWNSGRQS